MVIFALIAVRGEGKWIESVGVGPIWCEEFLQNKVRHVWSPCSEMLLYSVRVAQYCKQLQWLVLIPEQIKFVTLICIFNLGSSVFVCIMLRFWCVELCSLSRDESNLYQKGKLTVHWIISSLWSASWTWGGPRHMAHGMDLSCATFGTLYVPCTEALSGRSV